MPDDLTQLRLDVARKLKWAPFDTCEIDDGMTWQNWAAPDVPMPAFVFISSTGQTSITGMPNWPADLGACQEVLDAIRERNWRYRIGDGKDENGEYAVGVSLMDATRVYAWPQVAAPTLSAAICRAFVQAVEASRGH